MSRIGKAPIPVPVGVDVTIDGRARHREGPEGHARACAVPGAITVRQDGGELLVERPDDERENRALHGLTRSLVNNMVVGVHRRFTQGARDRRRRLPRRRPRARQRSSWPSASATRSWSTRPTASPSRCRRRPASSCAASTRRSSARWPPTSARSASPSPTRARACATSASSVAAQGRQDRRSEHHERQRQAEAARPGSAATAGCARRSTAPPSVRASPCSVRTSTSPLQVIDDDTGRTLAAASTTEADLRGRRHRQQSTPPRRSASSSPSGPRPPASTKVVFDRGGFLYHGRVAAVADAAREAGLEF